MVVVESALAAATWIPAKAAIALATVENHWAQVSALYERELERLLNDPNYDVLVVDENGAVIPGLPFQRGARFVRRAEHFVGSSYAERFELNGPRNMVGEDVELRLAGNEMYDYT